MRFSFAALAVVALAHLASATYTPKPGNCKKNEFWFVGKACCVPIGGPPKPTPPPTGTQCPPGWAWEGGKKCCLPKQPPPPSPPVPSCPKGWTWYPFLFKCMPTPQPPKPHPPVPSKPVHPKPPKNPWDPKPPGHGHGHGKRSDPARIALCPTGLRACPLPGLISGEYECLDTTAELTSCGGCVSEGKGQDCTAIPGAWNVGCEDSSCVVRSCTSGYELSADNKTCVPL